MTYNFDDQGEPIIPQAFERVFHLDAGRKYFSVQYIKQILDTDRAAYDREYGADDAYWMLQDNVMQLQWKQEPSPATAQLEEWGRKYVVYNGQYDVVFDSGSKEASEEDKITKLWSQTLPALLMAPSEEEFDTLFEEFIEKRDELGYTDVMEKKTAYMNSAKEKLGIQ